MNAAELRALQAPLKARYKEDPAAARFTHRARATLVPGQVGCTVETAPAPAQAGLTVQAGGDGRAVCSADMLLQALVACAGVTLTAEAVYRALREQRGDPLEEA